jgi:hypothetical protein
MLGTPKAWLAKACLTARSGLKGQARGAAAAVKTSP